MDKSIVDLPAYMDDSAENGAEGLNSGCAHDKDMD
jgi:hypothetical protein